MEFKNGISNCPIQSWNVSSVNIQIQFPIQKPK